MVLAAHPRVLANPLKNGTFRLILSRYWVRMSSQHPNRSCQSGLVKRKQVYTVEVLYKGPFAPMGRPLYRIETLWKQLLRDAQKPGYESRNTYCKRSALTVHYPSATQNSPANTPRTQKRSSEHGDLEFEMSTLDYYLIIRVES